MKPLLVALSALVLLAPTIAHGQSDFDDLANGSAVPDPYDGFIWRSYDGTSEDSAYVVSAAQITAWYGLSWSFPSSPNGICFRNELNHNILRIRTNDGSLFNFGYGLFRAIGYSNCGATYLVFTGTKGDDSTVTYTHNPLSSGAWDTLTSTTLPDFTALKRLDISGMRPSGCNSMWCADNMSLLPPTYRLSVGLAGSGTGTVTSNPIGIDCGSDCSESYAPDEVVTLTAAPSSGSVFGGWSGAGCSGTGACVVTMDADKSATATFALPQIAINDVSAPEGDSGATDAIFTATLSPESARSVTVRWSTSHGTATAGSDYTAASGTLSFAPGSTTQTLAVPVLGDTVVETDETFTVTLSSATNAEIADGTGMCTILNDDAPSASDTTNELTHGAEQRHHLASLGATPDQDWYWMAQKPYSSYELVVDEASGDISPVALERVASDGSTIVQSGVAVGIGPSRGLRWQNATGSEVSDEWIRVASGSCTSDCGADDVYRIRAYETTYTVPRFNNSGTQVTVLVVQNPTDYAIAGSVYFWSTSGTLLATQAFSLPGKQTLVLNTASVSGAAGASGTTTVSHDGRYGDLAGKTVALEPATGFSFDTPMAPRAR